MVSDIVCRDIANGAIENANSVIDSIAADVSLVESAETLAEAATEATIGKLGVGASVGVGSGHTASTSSNIGAGAEVSMDGMRVRGGMTRDESSIHGGAGNEGN